MKLKALGATVVIAAAVAGASLPAFAASTDAWSMEAECGTCHVKQAESMAAEGSNGPAAEGTVSKAVEKDDEGAATEKDPEPTAVTEQNAALGEAPCLAATHKSLGCTTCHADEEKLTKVHDGVAADDKMPRRLKKAKIDEATCLGCHGSYEELAKTTADSKVLTDKNGTTVNPHAVPKSESHDALNCVSCHTVHEAAEVAEVAQNECRTCHHADVYTCGTCH